MDKNSLAHTQWECKYHIVFAPKYRGKIIYGKIKADIAHILSELCKRKGIDIIAAEVCPDHIHMFVRIPPKYSVSEIMGYLKGKSSPSALRSRAGSKEPLYLPFCIGSPVNGSMYSFNVIWSYSKSSFNWFRIYSSIFFAFFPTVST